MKWTVERCIARIDKAKSVESRILSSIGALELQRRRVLADSAKSNDAGSQVECKRYLALIAADIDRLEAQITRIRNVTLPKLAAKLQSLQTETML